LAATWHGWSTPAPDDHEIEPFTREEARLIFEAAKGRQNAARWSVALALGIRQGEALGLRWSYVDLETGVIKAWFQIQRAKWQHGCDDPHECGKKSHRVPCPKNCKQHRHQPDCSPDCKKRTHRCPRQTCGTGCTEHGVHIRVNTLPGDRVTGGGRDRGVRGLSAQERAAPVSRIT
jgi:hypothetical protein